jgi:hypothetical protein
VETVLKLIIVSHAVKLLLHAGKLEHPRQGEPGHNDNNENW